MEIKVSSYRQIARRLDSLTGVMERLVEDIENWMRQSGYDVPIRQRLTQKEREVEISYTDEEADVVRELKKAAGQEEEEE